MKYRKEYVDELMINIKKMKEEIKVQKFILRLVEEEMQRVIDSEFK